MAKYETLFDWLMFGGKPIIRNDSFGVWTSKVLGYCVVHFLLSAQGLAAAALAFKYQLIHFVWICCVLLNCIYSGYAFYEKTINPSDEGDNGECLSPIHGLKRCVIAWIFAVLPAYWYCRKYPNHATIQKTDIANRQRLQQEEKDKVKSQQQQNKVD